MHERERRTFAVEWGSIKRGHDRIVVADSVLDTEKLLAGGEAACSDGDGIAFDRGDDFAGELGQKRGVVRTSEVAPQIFPRLTQSHVAAEKACDGIGAIFGGCAITDLAGDGGVFAYGASNAEIEGVNHLAVLLDLFSLEADVGYPTLAAGIGAAGDMEAELLIEGRKAFFQFRDEPLIEGLGFGNGEFAEFGAGAGDGATVERRTVDAEAEGI